MSSSTSTQVPAGPVATPSAAVGPPVAQPARRWWSTCLHALPNVVVFSLLGGVMVFGHHTDWKMPKMSELTGAVSEVADDWCAEHLVPEASCIECQADLLPKREPVGFCPAHGVAECVIHHPELAQIKGDPQLPKYDTTRAISVVSRPANNSRDTLHASRVQFTSVESIAKAGIDVDVVQERLMSDSLTANGELIFDPTRVAHLAARVPGTVAAVFKVVGDHVEVGDILALVDASQVGQAKSQFLQANVQLQLRKTNVERLRPIAQSGAVTPKSLIEAEAAWQEAQVSLISSRQALENLGFELPETLKSQDPQALADQLRFLGIPASLVDALATSTRSANLIPVRATYDGVLVNSEVVSGEVIDTGRTLFTVSDPRRIWLMLNVRQEDAKYVRRGLPVRFQPDSGDSEISGQVAWISPAIDEATRTLRVRVVVDNADGALRDRTFGTGRIVLREEPHAVVVPRAAVQATSDAHFVFVRDKNYFDQNSPKFFHVRQVRLGARDGEYVELLAGALPGEVIVSQGSNVLLAQLLRSNLGAGCGCHDH